MHPTNQSSVVLIGMPGCGKSTIGVMLAKELGLGFVDTDILIQQREGKTLQQIIDGSDYLQLRKIEEQVLLENDYSGLVVATGGSVVYSDPGMQRLKEFGAVVYLQCPVSELIARVKNYATRGVAAAPGLSLDQVAEERGLLYQRYADLTLKTAGTRPDDVLQQVVELLRK